MTIRDYIGQKFSAYGDLSEADMLDFSIKSGLSPDDEMSSESIGKVETGMIEIIPSLLLRPDSVNESGFSVSWDKDASGGIICSCANGMVLARMCLPVLG